MHNDDQYRLMRDGLTPGEYNPLDHEPTYNPLRHCYHITTTIDDINYEIAVTFQLQLHNETTPIQFTDPKTGQNHTIPFFPKMPEFAIDPILTGPEPPLDEGYQLGEPHYYLVPLVHRCKRLDTGHLLSREATSHLILPEVLQQTIINYRDKVEQDENAPAILLELLNMWDPAMAYMYQTTDEWNDNEPDTEDYFL